MFTLIVAEDITKINETRYNFVYQFRKDTLNWDSSPLSHGRPPHCHATYQNPLSL